MKRLLITGGSGNLGYPLSKRAARTWNTTCTYYRHPTVGGGDAVWLDMRDQQAVLDLVRDLTPHLIIHTAASDRSEEMVETNRKAAEHISEAARQIGAYLIALSSDIIFDGSNPPYGEDDPPTPLSPYGQVKAENEKLLLSKSENCLVVRTSLIYDLHPANNQVSWMLRAIEADQPVTLFVDEIRQPIWVWNLAEALLELANNHPARGILNVAGPQSLSRWEFGCAVLRALGYDPDRFAEPVRAADVAPHRPRDCSLRLDKALAFLKTPLLSVNEALELAR